VGVVLVRGAAAVGLVTIFRRLAKLPEESVVNRE